MTTQFAPRYPTKHWSIWLSAILLSFGFAYTGFAAEWQTLKEGKTRIILQQTDDAPEPETSVPLPEGLYSTGEGQIESAFGLVFGQPIDPNAITMELGWRTPAQLPEGLTYRGFVKPLTIREVSFEPSAQPALLRRQEVTYEAQLDFDGVPISIETSRFQNADRVIEIIKRKYGEPEAEDAAQIIYQRDKRMLHIYRTPKNNEAFLRYVDAEVATAYLDERNRSLKRKFRELQFDRLSPEEARVVALAQQFVVFRQDGGSAFGQPFGKRVSFRAKPDVFVPFKAPKPFPEFDTGEYKIMVSPDLMPVALRYEVLGNDHNLALVKHELELAMELAFAGFLKQSPHHTVVSFKQHAYSLLIRDGKFQFTMHDRHENGDRRERERFAKLEIANAKKELERLAELERQRQAIAARQKQIEEEKAF